MKKMMMTLIALLTMSAAANAMSYEQARNEALFLTDKMAYELDLTDEQYEAAYEINLDYLMGVTSPDDVYGIYWERRNLDMSYILYSWQWDAFCAASYFFRPLYWNAGRWHFGIYARYTARNYFYFGHPTFYVSYRGGHAWHLNGGRSYYYGRRDHFRPAINDRHPHYGMRQRFDNHNNGGYRGNQRFDNRNDRQRFDNRNDRQRFDNRNNGGYRGNQRLGNNSDRQRFGTNNGNQRFGTNNDRPRIENNSNHSNFRSGSSTRITAGQENRPSTNMSSPSTTTTRPSTTTTMPNRPTTTTTPNRHFGSGSGSTTTTRPTTTMPNRPTTTSTPSRSFGSSPSRSTSSSSTSSSSSSSRSFGNSSSSSSSRSFGSSSSSSSSRSSSGSGSHGHFGGHR